MKAWQHFCTVTRHRHLVMRYCFRLGLYRQGLCHDLSKYSPAEFIPGAKYYLGYRSPNDAERMARGYSAAWLHHKGRNKHHLEYWTDTGLNPGEQTVGLEIPLRYVAEMVCDRIAAGQTYKGKDFSWDQPYAYYLRSRPKYLIHPNTAALLEDMLLRLKEQGPDETFRHIRRLLEEEKKNRKRGHT